MTARGLLAPCLVVLALWGCGDGSVCFGSGSCNGNGGDSDRTVSVDGNVDTVTPPNAVRDLVVFVYTELKSADLADGPPFDDYKSADAEVVADDDTFDLSRISNGKLTVIMLLDDSDPDGVIDPGDPCSVLRDGGDLSDVPGGRLVTIQDMDVNFNETSCPDPPPAAGCGCSSADDIMVRVDPSTGGTPPN